ncbi:ScaI family restriction endonuclease [Prevotella stercorea]|nr:ScaI family restriction endonuclease [Leyella stercorea]
MESPYINLPVDKWRSKTEELVNKHPLKDKIKEVVLKSWEDIFNLNSATVSINRLSDSKLSLWCLGALFDCCISRDKPFHPLTPPSDLRQYAVENRQEIRISQSLY